MSTSMVEMLTDYELDTILRLAREAHRRSSKAAERNRETGLVEELPGADADAVRAANLEVLIAKLEELQEGSLPDSFMTATPAVGVPAEVWRERLDRVESDREAAEDLADKRGEMLADCVRATGTTIEEVLARVKDHLLATGEIDAGD